MKPTVPTLCLLAGIAGCSATPELDRNFGNAVRAARAQQTLNPNAGINTEPVAGIDGTAAKSTIERYHDSFKAPPPVLNVINIGGAIAGGGSGK